MDCYNSKIIGLTMTTFCIRMFEGAYQTHGAYGMILHNDRDSQITSSGFQNLLARYGTIKTTGNVHTSNPGAFALSCIARPPES
ncbi:hypothetical protein OBV_16530 [Oscillibacter valericigenes Sjm18-20]|nr:hypothetical protein OBV_16530 [Oscillibacter valericigenes Sjm18-20]